MGGPRLRRRGSRTKFRFIEATHRDVAWASADTGLAALAFVLGLVTHFAGPFLATMPEAYSSACTNLALLAIALVVTLPDRAGARRGVSKAFGEEQGRENEHILDPLPRP
jgi:hypothetical protein